MTAKSDYLCRPFRSSDEEAVKTLVKNAFGQFLNGDFWTWKYKLNPDFDPSLVMVAEKDGVIIGCNHWLPRTLVLSPSLETRAVLGADVAVSPEYQGKGVGTALLHCLRSSKAVASLNPEIAFMFADPSLAKKFHTPAGGYFSAPNKTVTYSKILSWTKFEDSANFLNKQIADGKFNSNLSRFKLKVLFRISNTPSLSFAISKNGVTLEKNKQAEINAVTIMCSFSIFQKIRMANNKKRAIIVALLTFRMRIKGKPSKFIALYRNLSLIQEILSRIIT